MKGGKGKVTVKTQRFGEIRVETGKIITMRSGILGFEHLVRYVLLVQDEKIPLRWLQSLDDPSVAFVVVDPLLVQPGYQPELDDADCESLGITSGEDAAMLVVVTIRSRPFSMSANLRAPVIINAVKRTASQFILRDPAYPIHHDCTDRGRWGLDGTSGAAAFSSISSASMAGDDDQLKPCR